MSFLFSFWFWLRAFHFILYLFSVHHVQKIQLINSNNDKQIKTYSIIWKVQPTIQQFIFIIAQTKSGNSMLKISRFEMVAKKGVLIETRTLRLSQKWFKLFQSVVVHRFQPIIFISIQLNQLGVCVGVQINSIYPSSMGRLFSFTLNTVSRMASPIAKNTNNDSNNNCQTK